MSLIRHDGRVAGAVAYDMMNGRFNVYQAKAVMIATGGAGRVVGQSSNALINTGDGAILAFRAGLPLLDMEFLQIHPTGILNGILITEGARGEGGYLVNKDGDRFMSKYAPKFMELAPRDLVAPVDPARDQRGTRLRPRRRPPRPAPPGQGKAPVQARPDP